MSATAIGAAFIRIRPDTTGFRSETQAGVKRALAGAAAITGVSLGVAEVIRQVKAANAAAREAETIQAQAAAALKARGDAWSRYGAEIEAAANKQAKLQAFDDEEVVSAFTRIYTNVGDVKEALDLAGLAGQLATSRMTNGQRDLASASLIVAKVAGGNVGILRRYGIQLDKNATSSEALAALQQKLAGRAEAYARGSEGAQARLNKVWGDTQEIIGGELIPVIAEYQRKLADWLEQANETGDTQRVLDETIGNGREVVKGMADAFQTLHDITGPVVDALGGTEKAVKLLLLAMAAQRALAFAGALRQTAGSFGLVATASTKATAVIQADAAATTTAVQAEAAAVTEAKTAEALAAERSAARIARASRIARGAAAVIGTAGLVYGQDIGNENLQGVVNVATYAALGFTITGGNPIGAAVGAGVGVITTSLAHDKAKKQQVQQTWNALTPEQQRTVLDELRSRPKGEFQVHQYLTLFDLKLKPIKVDTTRAQGYRSGAEGDVASAAVARRQQAARPSYEQVQGRIAAFEETQLNARIKNDQARERRSLAAEKTYVEERLKDARLNVSQRRDLKAKLESVQNDIDSIDDQIQSAKDAAAAKTRTNREQARQAADKAWTTRLDRRLGQLERSRREAEARDDIKTQQQILAQEEAFLRRLLAAAKGNAERRDRLLDEISSVNVAQTNLRKSQAGTDAGIDKQYAEMERRRREAAAADDIAAQQKILAQEEQHLRKLIANAKAGSDRMERLKNELVTVHERQAKLVGAADSSGSGEDVFAQAAAIFRDYGGYIDARVGGPLSVQGARAMVAAGIIGGTAAPAAAPAAGSAGFSGGPQVGQPSVATVVDRQQALGEQQLAEERRQTTLLQTIAANTVPRPKPTTPPGSVQKTVHATGDSYVPTWSRGL